METFKQYWFSILITLMLALAAITLSCDKAEKCPRLTSVDLVYAKNRTAEENGRVIQFTFADGTKVGPGIKEGETYSSPKDLCEFKKSMK